jgi:chromosome segregation protein
MARLKELKLHGFKTFADPTRFVFERGVTAVIGPNGSGKSNMADAVRWVLGEQSNRSLRTRRADDVIFAGSQGRRPRGMAEAVLTLDNSDGWLPIDFAEVSIGRRAYRSGETEYLINGARSRLKEVVELLGAGRLGANELVVVGQGTVDAALSLRPEERRQLFEEAAGVKNLQVRKNEALGRLARARDNLTRVGDLIGELKPQVRRLSQQAQHQQEHNALRRRAHALVIEAHRRRERLARASLGDARRRMAGAEAALEALRAEESAGREAIQAAEDRYWSAEAAARAAAERREASRETLIRADAVADAVARRHSDLGEALARAEAELAELIAALDARPGQDEGESEARHQAAREAEGIWQAASAAVEAIGPEMAAADQALSAARAGAGAWIADAARRDEAAARGAARVERLEEELAAATTASTEAIAAVERAQVELAAAEAAEGGSHAALETAQRAADDAQQQAAQDRARATALAERVGGLRAELELLQERAEGSARLGSVLAAAGWRPVLDQMDPPQEAWAAVETLIGGELAQAMVWRDDGVIHHAAEARGLVRLLADDTQADATPSEGRTEALAAVHGTRTLAEWIGTDQTPRLFARTAVAPDLASLLNGWRRLPAGWSAVTADGDLADERGLVVVRGRDEPSVGEAARQHAHRRELADLLVQLESEQAEAAKSAARALVASAAAASTLVTAALSHGNDEGRTAVARGVHDGAAEAMARAADRERLLGAELAEARAAIEAGGAPTVSPSPIADIERLAARTAEVHRRHAALSAERDRLRSAWQKAQSAADASDDSQAGRPYQQAVLTARREQLSASIAADRESLATQESERTIGAAALADAAAADQLVSAERVVAEGERDRLRIELVDRERTQGGAASRLVELEREVQGSAIEAQRLEDELVAIGRERDLAIGSLPASDDGGSVPDDDAGSEDLPEVALEAIDAELTRVRRTLAQIGSVNPFAIEEHRELDGRLQALAGQDADLSAAIASTQELIGRLEAEIAGQFNAAFVAIGAQFDEFCRLLFAGGSASLQMSEAGDADAAGGIEIAVQPPGKRLQRLAMLSGGERALAGVALLFAMLSVNPVPFCILDEVDAALDEANIGRFADALRKLAEQIDFVVITHNRATIETADTIYGVTMTDAAVSRLLSLRLADLPAEVVAG